MMNLSRRTKVTHCLVTVFLIVSGAAGCAQTTINDMINPKAWFGDSKKDQKAETKQANNDTKPPGDAPSQKVEPKVANTCVQPGRAEPFDINSPQDKLRTSCMYNVGSACWWLAAQLEQGGDLANSEKFYKKACLTLGCDKRDTYAFRMKTKQDTFAASMTACSSGAGAACLELGRAEAEDCHWDSSKSAFLNGCKLGEFGGCKAYLGLMKVDKKEEEATSTILTLCKSGTTSACTGLGVRALDDEQLATAKEYFKLGCDKKDADSCAGNAFVADKEDSPKEALKYLTLSCKYGSNKSCDKKKDAEESIAFDALSVTCKCKLSLKELNHQKNEELAIGKTSGFVDKVKLHSIGTHIVAINRYLSKARIPAGACKAKFDSAFLFICLEAAGDASAEE